jgi:hypothetical protein
MPLRANRAKPSQTMPNRANRAKPRQTMPKLMCLRGHGCQPAKKPAKTRQNQPKRSTPKWRMANSVA